MMGAIKRAYTRTVPVTTAGSASAFTLTFSVAPGALYDAESFTVLFHAANSASATLNINGLGAKPLHILKPAGWGVIPANTVINGMVCRVAYNSSAGAYRIIDGTQTAVVSGTAGYTVGPNSMRKQWGQAVVPSAAAPTITYPVAFSAIPYIVHITPLGATGIVTNMPYPTSVTASNFQIVNSTAAASTTFMWTAEGPA
jgi:hypothetical protein